VYFYASQRKDIPLKGRMLDGNRLVLEEFDSAGIAIARYEAEFPEKLHHNSQAFWLAVKIMTEKPLLPSSAIRSASIPRRDASAIPPGQNC
jgi:hypothetical protein